MMNRFAQNSRTRRGILGFFAGVCLVASVGFYTLGIDLVLQVEALVTYSILASVIGILGCGVAVGDRRQHNQSDDDYLDRSNISDHSLPTYNDGSAAGYLHVMREDAHKAQFD